MLLSRFKTTAAAALFGSASLSFATPSGLNNIPTADTTPQGTFVLQAFSTLGADFDDDFNLGFKSGLDLGPVKFEFGLATNILPDDAGPVTVHGKLAVPFGENLPTLAAGVANTTFSSADKNRAGEAFGYLVLSHDFGFIRAHAGCGLQDDEAQPFFGFDKTFRTAGGAAVPSAVNNPENIAGQEATASAPVATPRDLFTLRADGIRQRDSSWLYSAGVLVPVTRHIVFETWGNFPDNGDDFSLTLKLNFVVQF